MYLFIYTYGMPDVEVATDALAPAVSWPCIWEERGRERGRECPTVGEQTVRAPLTHSLVTVSIAESLASAARSGASAAFRLLPP